MKAKKKKPVTYFPVSLDIHGRKCTVVGGGKVALRKVEMLLGCGAKVIVIDPKPHPEILKLSNQRRIHLIKRDYEGGDLKDAMIAMAVTDKKMVNRQVTDEAKKAGVLINVADDPEPSDFIIPSFFRRGNLTLAVSTAGISPALARKIRTKLEKSFGEEYATLLSIIGEVRSIIKRKGFTVTGEAWQEALDLDLLIKLVKANKRGNAKTIILGKLEAPQKGKW